MILTNLVSTLKTAPAHVRFAVATITGQANESKLYF